MDATDLDLPQPVKKPKISTKTPMASPHGNYNHYYLGRHASGDDQDPRLQLLQKDWFNGRKCLDIGCNDGSFTTQIANTFKVPYYLGIDIDPRLIDRAWQSADPQDNSVCCCWRREDFSTEDHVDLTGYDTVTAFSVVKWVHLNHGDSGVCNFFAKCFQLLRPGGILIIEPQDWASYRKNKGSSDTARLVFGSLKIRPSDFPAILVGPEVGFVSCEEVSAPQSLSKPDPGTLSSSPGLQAGFQRPLLVCTKGPLSPPGDVA